MTTIEDQHDIPISTDIYGNLAESTTAYTLKEEIQILNRLNNIYGENKVRSDRIIELMVARARSKVLIYTLSELVIIAILVLIHLITHYPIKPR
jgi:hypothetical protein